jgi:acetolactate synthase regulatory subunit
MQLISVICLSPQSGLTPRFKNAKEASLRKVAPCGEVAEWLKAPLSKSGIPFVRDRGFESHPLRHVATPPFTEHRIRRDVRVGRRSTTGNRVCRLSRHRGFESLSLRHPFAALDDHAALMDLGILSKIRRFPSTFPSVCARLHQSPR